MKLNNKRTVLVGFAFLSICAFWQLYDNVIPLILKHTFGIGDDVAGVIMSLDNVLALFLLPFFGTLSDRSTSRFGKRMPFIVCGTLAAVLLMNLLPYADNTKNLVLFIVVLGLLLIAMGTYRSPAVALMPDVTPKPLRSKGNAIINLMGALGGVFTLGVTSLLLRKGPDERDDYSLLFAGVALLMVISVVVLVLTIRERKLAKEVAELEAAEAATAAQAEASTPAEAPEAPSQSAATGWASIPPDVRRSLLFILISVSLWFMGYNAVTTSFTKYVSVRWSHDLSSASTMLLVANVGAIISYLPVGMLSSRLGRKRVIQAGVLLLATCFGVSALFAEYTPAVYVVFALVGIAWAMINVNSYPMVVEISQSGDVGKFTGYYYTFSMAAQVLTPILSGYLLEHVGYWTLLPYAALMVALSFVTISLTKHGDVKPQPPASTLEAFDVGDD